MANRIKISNWRSVLGYRIEPTEFKAGARVMIDIEPTEFWDRTEYPQGAMGVIVARYGLMEEHGEEGYGPAWIVCMDDMPEFNADMTMEEREGNYPAFYQKDLKLI